MARTTRRPWSDDQILARRDSVDAHRFEREARRAKATAGLVPFQFVRGDLHMHTDYSDGSNTVADMERVARLRGLDFIFVTDHGTIRQKRACEKYRNVWWGQEPGAGLHHVCILAGKRRYEPYGNVARDAARLREMGLFFFFPHPTGWYPSVWYSEEQKDALAEAGPQFAIEVMNGIFRTDPFHDKWTEANVALWDRSTEIGASSSTVMAVLCRSSTHFPW